MAKYLKQDCEKGYIVDHAEIEYARFNNLRHSILGCMLGDYDLDGRYVVAPEIKNELIKMPKYIVDSMDNIEICASVLKLDKQITFMVTFEEERATLSLIEKISFEGNVKLNCGSYSNINEYVLDQVETSGVINKNAIYQLWNISEFAGNVLDIFNADEETIAAYFNLTNRFKYLMQANTVFLKNEKKLEEIESTYANRLLEILKAYPKLQKIVEKELKETLIEKKDFISMDKPNYAKTINEIIEKSIENNIDVLEEHEKESFQQEKHFAQVEINILRRDVVEFETTEIDIKDLNIQDDLSEGVNTEVLTPPQVNEDVLTPLQPEQVVGESVEKGTPSPLAVEEGQTLTGEEQTDAEHGTVAEGKGLNNKTVVVVPKLRIPAGVQNLGDELSQGTEVVDGTDRSINKAENLKRAVIGAAAALVQARQYAEAEILGRHNGEEREQGKGENVTVADDEERKETNKLRELLNTLTGNNVQTEQVVTDVVPPEENSTGDHKRTTKAPRAQTGQSSPRGGGNSNKGGGKGGNNGKGGKGSTKEEVTGRTSTDGYSSFGIGGGHNPRVPAQAPETKGKGEEQSSEVENLGDGEVPDDILNRLSAREDRTVRKTVENNKVTDKVNLEGLVFSNVDETGQEVTNNVNPEDLVEEILEDEFGKEL